MNRLNAYKDRQWLVFEFPEGGMVKYNLATHETIGKSGKVVQNLSHQLSRYSFDQVCESFSPEYGRFLQFVKGHTNRTNIGSVLECVAKYADYEQIFATGIKRVKDNLKCKISDVPKGLIKLCKEHDILLDRNILDEYKAAPDFFNLAYSLPYRGLTDTYLNALVARRLRWNDMRPEIVLFAEQYNYNIKSLLMYLDYLYDSEALTDAKDVMRELDDYARMMFSLSPKFEKYPKNFLTTHKIASRNYNRLKKIYDEKLFEKTRDLSLEWKCDDYIIVYPKVIQDIRDEAVQQNNCVASYIQKVLDGTCHIMFLRKKENPNESLVTLEIRDGIIVQAKRKFNREVSQREEEIIQKYNARAKKKKLGAA